MRPSVVLFDLDHTLLDFDRAQARALRGALEKRGLTFSPARLALYRRINDALWERYRRGEIRSHVLAVERFRQLLAALGGRASGAQALSAAFTQALARQGDLMPGCRAALKRLRRRFRLGVVTNGLDYIQRSRLRVARLSSHFETVVTSEACGFAKPDPRILHAALAEMRVAPAAAVYVGDDPAVDGAAARAAGVPFLWLQGKRPLAAGVPRPRRRAATLAQAARLLL